MTRQRDVSQIRTQIERMRALVRSPELARRNERVSGWSTAEHLDHMTKVAHWALRKIAKAQPAPNGINLMGRLVLLLGWLPRGIGKAPAGVVGVSVSAVELDVALTALEHELDALPLDGLRGSRAQVVPHPRFGGLTPSQGLRMVVVHTNHHLRIIDDILRS